VKLGDLTVLTEGECATIAAAATIIEVQGYEDLVAELRRIAGPVPPPSDPAECPEPADRIERGEA
jgi:hypothetical protein